MRAFLVACFATLGVDTAYADCPTLPAILNFSKFTYAFAKMEGNYKVTYRFPDLKAQVCTHNYDDSFDGYTFDLSQNPIQVEIELNGQLVQTDTVLQIGMFTNSLKPYYWIQLLDLNRLRRHGVLYFRYDKMTGDISNVGQPDFKVFTR